MEKIFEVILSSTAIDSYEAIVEQIHARWGEKVANKFELKAFKTLEILKDKPFVFKEIDNYPNLRKGLVNKNCSFFYEVSSSQVQILFFWDNRQEPLFNE
ncbi:hypothetical protein DSL64_15060 [Dyadobacter luteus]|uniref:Type II toxin-antitoxin system RelE/ParE family toxin n=1 Tax=Dyadobacter luteus TaxID=2259619 RepID=A0A3D8YA55_9BACT|nr:type II toxin-antitoxin system RelE/ParE family toxin [Dyadobacter luteus]REA60427.1 hypothetical protein DSL64_15060 [Dyadobacter luteus]